jgi:broad specificity phosphatase PhoE
METIILELEREKNDLLIIAHESVLRVLYGYLMACSTQDIPTLSFPRNEIVEVRILDQTRKIESTADSV